MKKITAIILCLLIGILSACQAGSKNENSPSANVEKDGVLNIAGARAYESSREGASLVFDTLTGLDEYYHATPSIVSEWKPEKDFTEYNLTIKDGIKFHDGTELTADIVKWNIENGGAINYCGYSYLINKVEVVDKTHLKVSFTAPYLYFDRDLALVPCIKTDGYTKEGKFKGNFSAQHHFFGYEGRCAAPSNFDADYCYALGTSAAQLVANGKTGYMAIVKNTTAKTDEWRAGGVPITMMMNMERRNGEMKPVIRKALVELDGKPFKSFAAKRDGWAKNTEYIYPGPIQYWGPTEVCDLPTKTLILEQE